LLRRPTLTIYVIPKPRRYRLASLPKLALLPAALAAQPALALTVLPLSLAVDCVKAKASAALTARVEGLAARGAALEARRSKVQQHDAAHAALLYGEAAAAATVAALPPPCADARGGAADGDERAVGVVELGRRVVVSARGGFATRLLPSE